HTFATRDRDVNEFVAELDFAHGLGRIEKRVTYQDACHLAHGQRIREAPRQIVTAIPGIELVEMTESDFCCGSAGIYNLTHPGMAARLLELKMVNVAATKTDM